MITTQRRRGSRTLNRICVFLAIMDLWITLRLNNTHVLEHLPWTIKLAQQEPREMQAQVKNESRRWIRLSSGWSGSCSYPGSWASYFHWAGIKGKWIHAATKVIKSHPLSTGTKSTTNKIQNFVARYYCFANSQVTDLSKYPRASIIWDFSLGAHQFNLTTEEREKSLQCCKRGSSTWRENKESARAVSWYMKFHLPLLSARQAPSPNHYCNLSYKTQGSNQKHYCIASCKTIN